MSKYKAKKTVVDGITFDSKKEADYYCELRMRRCAGEINDFDLQVVFELQPSFKCQGKTIRAIKYIADFVIHHRDGSEEIVDVKGMRLETYKIKKKMFQYKHPDIKFTEV